MKPKQQSSRESRLHELTSTETITQEPVDVKQEEQEIVYIWSTCHDFSSIKQQCTVSQPYIGDNTQSTVVIRCVYAPTLYKNYNIVNGLIYIMENYIRIAKKLKWTTKMSMWFVVTVKVSNVVHMKTVNQIIVLSNSMGENMYFNKILWKIYVFL